MNPALVIEHCFGEAQLPSLRIYEEGGFLVLTFCLRLNRSSQSIHVYFLVRQLVRWCQRWWQLQKKADWRFTRQGLSSFAQVDNILKIHRCVLQSRVCLLLHKCASLDRITSTFNNLCLKKDPINVCFKTNPTILSKEEYFNIFLFYSF